MNATVGMTVNNGGTTLQEVQEALREMRRGENPEKNIGLLFTNLAFFPFFSLQQAGTTLEELHDFDMRYRDGVDPPFDPSYASGTFQDAFNALQACREGLLSDERWHVIIGFISDRDGFDGPKAPPEKLGTSWDEIRELGRLLDLRQVHEVLVRARRGDRTMYRVYFEGRIGDARRQGYTLEQMGTTQREIEVLAAQLR